MYGLMNTKKKHNFDKKLTNISTNTGVVSTTALLYTATYPCVVIGIVINGTVSTIYTSSIVAYQWFFIIIRKGQGIPSINFNTYPSSSIAPEEHVMVFGSGVVTPDILSPCNCKTKTSRKLMSGDTIRFLISTQVSPQTVAFSFTIQFFLRT